MGLPISKLANAMPPPIVIWRSLIAIGLMGRDSNIGDTPTRICSRPVSLVGVAAEGRNTLASDAKRDMNPSASAEFTDATSLPTTTSTSALAVDRGALTHEAAVRATVKPKTSTPDRLEALMKVIFCGT